MYPVCVCTYMGFLSVEGMMVVVKRGEESFEGGEEEEAELRLSSDFPPSLCRRSVGAFGLASASVRWRRGYARLVMEVLDWNVLLRHGRIFRGFFRWYVRIGVWGFIQWLVVGDGIQSSVGGDEL